MWADELHWTFKKTRNCWCLRFFWFLFISWILTIALNCIAWYRICLITFFKSYCYRIDRIVHLYMTLELSSVNILIFKTFCWKFLTLCCDIFVNVYKAVAFLLLSMHNLNSLIARILIFAVNATNPRCKSKKCKRFYVCCKT